MAQLARSRRAWSPLPVLGPLLCCVGTLACGGDSGSAGSTSLLGDAPEREVREVVRLGGVDAPEPEAFPREPELEVDGEGRAYVLHSDLGRVAVFDREGRFVRWIGGGRGPGPGEFTFPVRPGFVGDTLWVRNLTPPRISWFLRDGTHLGTDHVPVEPDYSTTAGVQGISGYLSDGRAWMEPDGFLRVREDDAVEAPLIVGDRAMDRQDTLFTWRRSRGRVAGVRFEPIPEPPFHDIAPDGSGILLAEWTEERPDTLRLRVLNPDGSERRVWRLALAGQPVPETVRDSLVEEARGRVAEVRERVLAQGVPEAHAPAVPSAAEVREQGYLPARYPPIRAVSLGLDGTIWIQVRAGAGEGPWVALDSLGAPLFQVRLPKHARFGRGSMDAIWGVELDREGVPYLVRWDIESDTSATSR